MTRERCVLCGELIDTDDPDAVEVGGGLAHEECIEERGDEGLFGESDPATGRDAASFECSVVELARERRERAVRTRRLRRS
jgi:hypothetical protein